MRRSTTQRATDIVDEVIEAAISAGQRAMELRAKILRARIRSITRPLEATEILRAAETAMLLLEEVGDDVGLAQAWQAIGETEWDALHFAAAVDALERSTVHARRAGDEAQIEAMS